MELGFHLPIFDIDGGTTAIAGELARVGAAAEASGATWLSFMDHYFQIEATGRPAESHMLEGYTTLGYLAAHTSTLELGLLVTGVTYRHPGLLAKIVTTVDVLSSGRAVLGLGAAWFEREHRALGVPYPPLAERFERLDEALRICTQMWDPDNNGPFEGKYYQLAETLCSPQPINRPKVLIGGSGERKTLRLVAQHGDACNLFGTSPEDVAHKLDVLRRHCDDVGRDYDDIRKTITANNPRPTLETRDEFVRSMADYAKLWHPAGDDHADHRFACRVDRGHDTRGRAARRTRLAAARRRWDRVAAHDHHGATWPVPGGQLVGARPGQQGASAADGRAGVGDAPGAVVGDGDDRARAHVVHDDPALDLHLVG